MPIPRRLLHPVPVYIRQIDKRFTVYDGNLKEPMGPRAKRTKTIKLHAQINVYDANKPDPTHGGVNERSTGYCLFLSSELHKLGVTIKRGDRIVQIGDPPNDREVDLYVTKFQWRGHYPRAAGPTLMKAFFEDRNPE